MFMEVRTYLAPKLTAEDLRIQVRGPPANYVYSYHIIPDTSWALGYVSYQKGIIQGHPDYRYATRDALGLCFRIMFRAVLSLDVSTQTVFLYFKYYLRGYFRCMFMSMLRTGCYAKQLKSMWFFNPPSGIYLEVQVNFSAIVSMCWLI